MAELSVDTAQMRLAEQECLRISEAIRAKIAFIQGAVDAPATWQGATRRAVIAQVEQQRPVLTALEQALAQGSATLKSAGVGFVDGDETMASAVGSAAAGAAQGGSPSALSGPALNA